MNHLCMSYFPFGHRVLSENPEVRLVTNFKHHWSKSLLCKNCHTALMSSYKELNERGGHDRFVISKWEECEVYE